MNSAQTLTVHCTHKPKHWVMLPLVQEQHFLDFFFLLHINEVLKPENSLRPLTAANKILLDNPKSYSSNPCSIAVFRDPDGLSNMMILVVHFPSQVTDRHHYFYTFMQKFPLLMKRKHLSKYYFLGFKSA